MPQEIELDDLDLQIIHALQIEPRVAWSALAPVVGADAVTLARRWQRIRSEGFAWQTAMLPQTPQTAIVEISCTPGALLDTAQEAAADHRIISIDITSGRRDLVLTFSAENAASLAEYAIDRFAHYRGVRNVQTHVLTGIIRLGSHWTVGALTAEQQALIPIPRPPRSASAKTIPDDLTRALRDALTADARMSYADLSELVGISTQRAADALARLRRTEKLTLRTDVAGPYSSWPVVAWYFLQVPTRTIQTADAALPQLPEVQFAASAAGPFNLIVAVSARELGELIDREADLERVLPGARIVDRSLVLRMHKHLGRRIGADGRALGPAHPLG